MPAPFRFHAAPTPSNPEHIGIEGGWAEANIKAIHVPELIHLTPNGIAFGNHLLEAPMLELFAEWDRRGLMPHVRTFDGCWSPRFKRQAGTPEERERKCRELAARPDGWTHLSNHATGMAFDLNARWNPLGLPPAPLGTPGGTRELAVVAKELGWTWGGDFHARPDPMHLEWAVPAPTLKGPEPCPPA